MKSRNDGRRQVHFWVTSKDYAFVCNLAEEDDETMASLFRRIIRGLRRQRETGGGAALVITDGARGQP